MRTRWFMAWAVAAAAAAGCERDDASDGGSSTSAGMDGPDAGEPTTGSEEADGCPGIEPGPSPIRRLNRREYDNTVHDLLGDETRPAREFPAEEEALGFNNNADAMVVTQLLAEHYLEAAEALAAAATSDLAALLDGCDVATAGEEACAQDFAARFGAAAYRRPLAAAEVEVSLAVYQSARAQFDFPTAIRLVATAILQSPHFLYRVEFGEPVADAPGVAKLTPHELASRLSYFLWGTMPDAALRTAADEGRLVTAADVAAQAQRMLGDPRARAAARDFHGQWLQLAHVDELEKDGEAFPEFDPAVRPLLRAEAEAFLDHVIWDGAGDLDTIYLAPFTFLNKPLADFYGVAGPTGEAFERVELDGGRASGFLTQGGLMAVLAKPNQTSPIHRGKFVRERLLCQVVPPPPDDVDITPPEVDPTLPTRERFKQHSVDPACAGCHGMMDPIGFGFEHFDGVGRWRESEAGQPIDATGEIRGGGTQGAFDGVPELAALLVESPEVEACMTLQWFRYAHGRAESTEDACTLAALATSFSGSGRRIQDLLVHLTQTDAFLYRRDPAGEGESP